MSQEEDLTAIKTDILMMKKDLSQIEKCLSNFEGETSNVSIILKELAVQEKVLEQFERRMLRLEEMGNRTSSRDDEFRREFHERLEDFRKEFGTKIDTFISSFEAAKLKEHSEILEQIKELSYELKKKNSHQDEKIETLDRWKWYITGAVVVISSIISLSWKSFFG